MKKGAAGGKKPAVKKGKPVKDPNKPKRPASAFFVFMYGVLPVVFCIFRVCDFVSFLIRFHVFISREDFRKTYKEKHPNNKSVSAVSDSAPFRSENELNFVFPEF